MLEIINDFNELIIYKDGTIQIANNLSKDACSIRLNKEQKIKVIRALQDLINKENK